MRKTLQLKQIEKHRRTAHLLVCKITYNMFLASFSTWRHMTAYLIVEMNSIFCVIIIHWTGFRNSSPWRVGPNQTIKEQSRKMNTFWGRSTTTINLTVSTVYSKTKLTIIPSNRRFLQTTGRQTHLNTSKRRCLQSVQSPNWPQHCQSSDFHLGGSCPRIRSGWWRWVVLLWFN